MTSECDGPGSNVSREAGAIQLPGRRAGRLGAGLGLHRALAVADLVRHCGARKGLLAPALPWYGVAAAAVAADQAAKLSIERAFVYGKQVEITPFFNLVHVLNPGAAFSFLAGASGWQRYFFITLGLLVAVWLIRQLKQTLPRFGSRRLQPHSWRGTWQRGGSPAARSGCGLPRLPLAGHALARVQPRRCCDLHRSRLFDR